MLPLVAVFMAFPAAPQSAIALCDSAALAEMAVLLRREQARRPAQGPEDVYKLIMQAALGSEHYVSDSTAASWLDREIANLGPGPAEAIMDTIAPRGSLVRLHLRPALERGIEPRRIAAAFAETARRFRSARECLAEYGRLATGLGREGALAVPDTALERLLDEMRRRGWPAIHHSERYAAAYRPAYRVLEGRLARELLAGARH